MHGLQPIQKLWTALGARSEPVAFAPVANGPLAVALAAVGREARQFLKPHWKANHESGTWPWESVSREQCGPTVEFLLKLLPEHGLNGVYRCGEGKNRQGFFDGENWNNHAWAEVDGCILDLTPDQFGNFPEVVVASASDPRYRPGEENALYREISARTAAFWWQDRQAAAHELRVLPYRHPGAVLSHRS